MYKIQTLNAISDIIHTQLSADKYTVSKDEPVPDAILVRSAAMHDMEFNKELLAIGRAGAGVNNIPLDKCSKEGIVVFNTPGANANAVAELVIAGLLMSGRNIAGGVVQDALLFRLAEIAARQPVVAALRDKVVGHPLGRVQILRLARKDVAQHKAVQRPDLAPAPAGAGFVALSAGVVHEFAVFGVEDQPFILWDTYMLFAFVRSAY